MLLKRLIFLPFSPISNEFLHNFIIEFCDFLASLAGNDLLLHKQTRNSTLQTQVMFAEEDENVLRDRFTQAAGLPAHD